MSTDICRGLCRILQQGYDRGSIGSSIGDGGSSAESTAHGVVILHSLAYRQARDSVDNGVGVGLRRAGVRSLGRIRTIGSDNIDLVVIVDDEGLIKTEDVRLSDLRVQGDDLLAVRSSYSIRKVVILNGA